MSEQTLQEDPEARRSRSDRRRGRAVKIGGTLVVAGLLAAGAKVGIARHHESQRIGGPKQEALTQINQAKHAANELRRLRSAAGPVLGGGLSVVEQSVVLDKHNKGTPITGAEHGIMREAPDALLLPERMRASLRKQIEARSLRPSDGLVEDVNAKSEVGKIDPERIIVPPADKKDGKRVFATQNTVNEYKALEGLVREASAEAVPGQVVMVDQLAGSATEAVADFQEAFGQTNIYGASADIAFSANKDVSAAVVAAEQALQSLNGGDGGQRSAINR